MPAVDVVEQLELFWPGSVFPQTLHALPHLFVISFRCWQPHSQLRITWKQQWEGTIFMSACINSLLHGQTMTPLGDYLRKEHLDFFATNS